MWNAVAFCRTQSPRVALWVNLFSYLWQKAIPSTYGLVWTVTAGFSPHFVRKFDAISVIVSL